MIIHRTYLQSPSRPFEIIRGIVETAKSNPFDELTVAVAYASLGGCEKLCQALENSIESWHSVKKRWLVSVDYGHTDPCALEYLNTIQNSTVRVPCGRIVIQRKLQPLVTFHPKAYVFSSNKHIGLFSGSANLTYKALHFNVEQATALCMNGPTEDGDILFKKNMTLQKQDILSLFKESESVTSAFIQDYESLLSRVPTRVMDVDPEVSQLFKSKGHRSEEIAKKLTALSEGTCFWIDCGKLGKNRGKKPGNQIDLQDGSRVFFGVSLSTTGDNTILKGINILFEGVSYPRSLRRSDNSMDKLNLPANHLDDSPVNYDFKTIMLRKNGGDTYELFIGDKRERAIWKSLSEEQDSAFSFGGTSLREFGVFVE